MCHESVSLKATDGLVAVHVAGGRRVRVCKLAAAEDRFIFGRQFFQTNDTARSPVQLHFQWLSVMSRRFVFQ